MLNKYIATIYIKNFFIIFLALEFFFVGIDIIQNLSKLPVSANMQILYVLNTSIFGANYTLPLSLVFGSIVTYINMVKTNQLQALYSIGYSKIVIVKPIFVVSVIITLLFMALNSTNFAYAKDNAKNILEKNQLTSSKENLFLKYFESYIHIEKLNPASKEAYNIDILEIKDSNLVSFLTAKKGTFSNDRWLLEDVVLYKKPFNLDINHSKLTILNFESKYMLDGFKPKIMDNLFDNKGLFSILDAIEAINLFSVQNIDTQKIKSILYTLIFFPLYAPLMSVIIFYYTPNQKRFYNLTMFATSWIFISLIIWGLLFLLVRLSESGVLIAEFSILFPIIILTAFIFYLYRFKKQII